jgi:hypothetical protein
MTTTPNLGLTTNDLDSGSTVYFQDWRLSINGVISNMSILDNFAGETTGSIVTIKANMGAYPVNAILITPPNYYEATNTAIISYSIGMLIDLVLDTTCNSAPEININFLGTKPLYKMNSSGSTIAVSTGDLRKNHHNIFSYQSTYWIWIGGATSIDQINFSGSANNFVSISSGSLLQDSGISASSILVGVAGSGIMSDSSGSVVKHNTSGIVSGSYNQVIVDSYGHVTSASIVASSGTIAGSGIMSTTTGSIVKHNISGVISGSYNQFTVDSWGHITSASFVATGSSSGGGHTIQDEGSPLTQRTNLNFVGDGVTATDNAGNDATVITINGGSSGSMSKFWNSMLPPTNANSMDDEFNLSAGSSINAKWIIFDSGSSLVINESDNGLNLHNTGSSISGIMQEVVAAGSFIAWTCQHQAGSPSTSDVAFGIFLGADLIDNPASSAILIMSVYFNSSGCTVINIGYWNYYNGTYTLLATSSSETFGWPPAGLFVRVRYNNSNYSMDFSTDSICWMNLYNGTFSAKQVGLFSGESTDARGIFSFFRVINSIDPLEIMRGNR